MAFLTIYKGRGSAKVGVGRALVDDEMVPHLQAVTLRYNGRYPAATVNLPSGQRVPKYLHYIVWEAYHGNQPLPPGHFLGHKNGDLNDNRIENLIVVDGATRNANAPRHRDNSTGYKGVTKGKKKFTASVGWNNEQLYLGTYDRACEAAHAVNFAYDMFYADIPTPNRISPGDIVPVRRREIEDNVLRLLHPRRAPRQRNVP